MTETTSNLPKPKLATADTLASKRNSKAAPKSKSNWIRNRKLREHDQPQKVRPFVLSAELSVEAQIEGNYSLYRAADQLLTLRLLLYQYRLPCL